MGRTGRLDWFGVALSLACSIHCLLAPVLFAVIPSMVIALHSFNAPLRGWAIGLIRLQAYETAFVAIAISLALVSSALGWRRHRCVRPLAWIAAATIAFSVSWSPAATSLAAHGVLAAVGGLMLVMAHLANGRLTRRARQMTHDRPAPT